MSNLFHTIAEALRPEISDNELIAKFAGLSECGHTLNGEWIKIGWYDARTNLPDNERFNYGRSLHVRELQYHKSWDWLMPVVERITKTKPMNQGWYDTRYSLLEGNIEIVYGRVVDFIKWYNAQPK